MSKCIIAQINIEAPEECDVDRLVADKSEAKRS